MIPFLALHYLAAKRGDGLRPELLGLLERSRAMTKTEAGSSAITGSEDIVARQIPVDPSQNHDEILLQDSRIPTERK